MSDHTLELLQANLAELQKSLDWLRRSYEKCSAIGNKPDYSPDEFDDFENLTSRYARATDLITNKVLRSLDAAELMEAGSIIDAANRAEKRGIVDSVSTLRSLKDLRNEIAHEYQTGELRDLF